MYHKPTKKDPKIGKKSVFVSNPRLKHNVTMVAVSAPIITLRQAQPKDNRRMVITTCCSIVHIYINMYKRIINRERYMSKSWCLQLSLSSLDRNWYWSAEDLEWPPLVLGWAPPRPLLLCPFNSELFCIVRIGNGFDTGWFDWSMYMSSHSLSLYWSTFLCFS